MKEIIKATENFSVKDKFNIKAGAQSLKVAVGETLTVKSACIGTDANQDGEQVSAGAIITTDNKAYTTISATAVDLIDSLIDLLNDDSVPDEINILVESRKSNSGRDYLVMSLV